MGIIMGYIYDIKGKLFYTSLGFTVAGTIQNHQPVGG